MWSIYVVHLSYLVLNYNSSTVECYSGHTDSILAPLKYLQRCQLTLIKHGHVFENKSPVVDCAVLLWSVSMNSDLFVKRFMFIYYAMHCILDSNIAI